MNLFDSSFLCLDIGARTVRGIAHRVRSARLVKSATAMMESENLVRAIRAVVSSLEHDIGARFDTAFITGNFGPAEFDMVAKCTNWSGEHKITAADLRYQISQIRPRDGFYPLHIIPLRYDLKNAKNLLTPVGFIDSALTSAFGVISYDTARLDYIFSALRHAHIQADNLYDPSYLLDAVYRPERDTAMFVNMGGEFTGVSIWTPRGPVFFKKIELGQNAITEQIAEQLHLDYADAARIKHSVASILENEMDRFTPADAAYDFSRADLNEILLPKIMEIMSEIHAVADAAAAKYRPSQIFLSGGGAGISGIPDMLETTFGIAVQNLGADAYINALSKFVWKNESAHVAAYQRRTQLRQNLISKITKKFEPKRNKNIKTVPIMPSTLEFNMNNPATYSLFDSGNISMIHVDIMDGFYVDRIAGGMDELKTIREHTRAHLHVHLMTESPAVWAMDAAAAGADTIIVSTNTAGVRAALRKIREMGKKNGIALNLESPVDILKPVLRELDEILIMAILPGDSGQEFDDSVLHKISVLANTRRKYGLKFKITVDGGINPDTAKLCWAAGADYLISASYLARAADFPLAVLSLMKH
jgi:ribulose-phosphate 3-epimerase